MTKGAREVVDALIRRANLPDSMPLAEDADVVEKFGSLTIKLRKDVGDCSLPTKFYNSKDRTVYVDWLVFVYNEKIKAVAYPREFACGTNPERIFLGGEKAAVRKLESAEFVPLLPNEACSAFAPSQCDCGYGGVEQVHGTRAEALAFRQNIASKIAMIETDMPHCGVGCHMKFVGRI
jgi:hypothetical protein